jgi:hypothetical protein
MKLTVEGGIHMRTKWARGKFGLPVLRYAITYEVTDKKKGLFGIPYKKKERRVVWVDWKTYSRIYYKPFRNDSFI